MHLLFPGQQNNEQIYLIVREHWIFLLLRWLVIVVLFLLLFAFQTYGPEFAPGLFEGTAGRVVTLFSQVFIMMLVAGIFLVWVLYYLNMQIVTDLRIVDIDQHGLFHRRISELHTDKIEDVTSDAVGVFATIFKYGNVYVQTAGTKERFEFDRVPNPETIEKLILDLYAKRSHEASSAPSSSPGPAPR
jgi:ABC-type multidrug transport system fused ATPase/permease subunit